jgi:hypothetical protein
VLVVIELALIEFKIVPDITDHRFAIPAWRVTLPKLFDKIIVFCPFSKRSDPCVRSVIVEFADAP